MPASGQVEHAWPCRKCRYDLHGLPSDGSCPECGTPVSESVTGPAPVGPGPLADDRPCLNCGYNLRGLDPAAVCPECGVPIARSLKGNLLQFSSPEYLAQLHRGVFLVQAAIIGQILITIGLFVAMAAVGTGGAPNARALVADFQNYHNVANTGVSIISLLGWWLLSAADPAFVGTDNGTSARKVVRVAVAARSAATVIVFAVGSADPRALLKGATLTPQVTVMMLAGLVSFIAWIVWYFAAMRYLRWLTPRLPNVKAHDRAKLLTWLGPLLYVFGCGIGQIVGLVMYYNLLEWVRKDLKSIRAAQAHPMFGSTAA